MKATKGHPYPEDFEEFLDRFPTEEDCRDYLEWVRWSDGFVCLKCRHTVCWKFESGIRKSAKCQKQISMTNGTVFDSGKKSLRLWFHVMCFLKAKKAGISAQNFCDMFGFERNQTTWGWLQKLRSVMIRSGRDQLSGRVEVNETYFGGQKEGQRGRGVVRKTLVLVTVEGDKGAKRGRVRFKIVKAHPSAAIKTFVSDYVAPGLTVETDGLRSYNFFGGLNIKHEPYVPSQGKPDAGSNLEHVHLVISLVKRWMLGTLQGAVTPDHMSGYLDEFAFRFNRRMSNHREKLFHGLVQQAITARPKNIKEHYNHRETK